MIGDTILGFSGFTETCTGMRGYIHILWCGLWIVTIGGRNPRHKSDDKLSNP